MTFNKDKFLQCKSYNDPFPVLEIRNFLNKDEAQLACEILDKADFDEFVMGNRKNIRKGTKLFGDFINKNKFISDLYNFFNDINQYEYILEKLLKLSKSSKLEFNLSKKPENFNKDYYAYKSTLHNKNFIKMTSNYLGKKFPKIFKKFFECFFLDMAFAEARRGYKIETHTDKPTRIIVFLLYLNDLNEEEGGGLEIYSTKSTDDKPTLHHTFKPKAGKLIAFLSNPVSFHNVQ